LRRFNEISQVVVLAATNFPDLIDKAMLRSGRFDKKIYIPKPDIKGREAIFRKHLEKTTISHDVDVAKLAKISVYKTGADIKNIINVASRKAVMEDNDRVTQRHLEMALEEVEMGRARTSSIRSDEQKRLTAYHEGGHAIVSFFTKECSPINKVTIVPRGNAAGYVSSVLEEDRNWTKARMIAQIDCLLGGRIAEEIVFGPEEVTSGAISDFEKASSLAEQMVCELGMSEKAGFQIFDKSKISESQKSMIDAETSCILQVSERDVIVVGLVI
jgi:ATP-dependent Zn protease